MSSNDDATQMMIQFSDQVITHSNSQDEAKAMDHAKLLLKYNPLLDD